MPSTFFGLTIAGSGLSTYQAAINTTANNISNVQTKGYSKQVAYTEAGEALRVHARYGTTGTGVVTTAIKQLRNEYYDVKYWENQGSLGYYNSKLYYMSQIESYFVDDDITTGYSTLFSQMFNNLDSVGSSAADETVRKTFISSAQSLGSYFNSVYTELQQLQSGVNEQIKTTVETVNSIAEKIAMLNKQINVLEVQGGYANELRDQRNLLIDELSEIVTVEVNEAAVVNSNYPDMQTGATSYRVTINGVALVDDYEYKTLSCTARSEKLNQSDCEGLYEIEWSDSGNEFDIYSGSLSGTLKALMEMRDGNNRTCFQGYLTSFEQDTTTYDYNVTFESGLSITSIYNMNMPASGTITINNIDYRYSGFTYNTTIDEDGNETITSYTFTLDNSNKDISAEKLRQGRSSLSTIGTSIDCMGIPYYQNQLNAFLRSFSQKFNNVEQSGVDLNGDAMNAFFVAGDEYSFTDYYSNYQEAVAGTSSSFTYTIDSEGTSSDSYYFLTAENFCVASASVADPRIFSIATATDFAEGVEAHDLDSALMALYDDVTVHRGSTAKDFLQCILDDISVDTEETTTFANNFASIELAITTQRTSISGVDEDEEALDLIKFQNAYNLSAKVISVLSEMYDQLILNTGL